MPDDDIKPTPDPTVLSTQALARAMVAERDWALGQFGIINERLNGMDRATKVLDETVTKVPTEVQREVMHLRELALEKFNSVQTQFEERDQRTERESKDNTIRVDAAFAAADKAADERNKSNTLAIAKSEVSTAETINKLAELLSSKTEGLGIMITANTRALNDKIDTNIQALNGKLDDLKERIGIIENRKVGAAEQVHNSQTNISQFLAVLGAVVAVVSIAVAVMIATRGGG